MTYIIYIDHLFIYFKSDKVTNIREISTLQRRVQNIGR